MGKPIGAMLVLAIAGALAGCGSDDDQPAATSGPVTTFKQVEGAVGGDAAGVEGVLEIQNGCLVVRGDRANEIRVTYPAFAEGSFTWDDTSQTLTADGHQVKVGDRVLLGGGAPATPGEVSAPEGCAGAETFFRVAPGGVQPASD